MKQGELNTHADAGNDPQYNRPDNGSGHEWYCDQQENPESGVCTCDDPPSREDFAPEDEDE